MIGEKRRRFEKDFARDQNGDRRSIGTRGTDRYLGGRPIQEEGRFAANEVGFA